MSIVQLTAPQRRQLRAKLRSAGHVGYYRRLLAVLELDRGKSVAEVADLLRVTRQSIYNWARFFVACPEPAALRDHYGIGRPSAWTEELRGALLASPGQRPGEVGYVGVDWTVPLLPE